MNYSRNCAYAKLRGTFSRDRVINCTCVRVVQVSVSRKQEAGQKRCLLWVARLEGNQKTPREAPSHRYEVTDRSGAAER